MSILIKGMEMPTEGEYSMKLYVCSDGSAYMDVASFPVDKDKFEAVSVPKHGRLIDADALDRYIYNDVPLKVFGNIARMAEMRNIVYHAPTIIEAEGKE